jgi:membrane protease YdiL (CAAX protease family)
LLGKAGTGRRARHFAAFLALLVAVFFLGITFSERIPDGPETVLRLAVSLALLLWALVLKRRGAPAAFQRTVYAVFVASTVLLASWLWSDLGRVALGLSLDTAAGLAVSKLSSAGLVVVGVVLLLGLHGERPASAYIRRGNLVAGLLVGVGTFVGLGALAFFQGPGAGPAPGMVVALLPWMLVFVLANGFMEEVLFRGLFLGRLEPLLGRWQANLLTALVFSLAHMQITYEPDVPVFLAVTFGLALLWGLVMQRTRSVWGSALFHAGADMLIVLQIFAQYGAEG